MRIIPFFALSTLLICTSESQLLLAQSKDKTPPTTPFSTALRKHFDKWDLNKDGKITAEELGDAFVRPKFKGEVAAVLACLKGLEREYLWANEKAPPFSLDDLTKYEAAMAAKRKVKLDLDVDFLDYKSRIAKTPRELFPEKLPKLSAIKQSGVMADCFFLCVVGAMVHHHPEGVRGMIQVKEGNIKHYLVNFAGTPKPVSITPPTDAEIALNTTALENGLWLTVLEKAFCAKVNRNLPKEKRVKEASDVHGSSGGASSDTIALFTGHDCFSMGSDNPKFLVTMRSAVASRCMITGGVSKKVKCPPGLRTGHVYSFIAMDPRTNAVSVFDPYGDNFTPKGTPGRTNGYERKNGVAILPWPDFVDVFGGALIEDRSKKAKF